MARKGRGIDFEHRFRTSRWAEDLLFNAINGETGFECFRLGLSQIAEDNHPDAGDVAYKEPDLIVFKDGTLTSRERARLQDTDLTRIGVSDIVRDASLSDILAKACCAIEVEFSPYRAGEMKGRHWKRRIPNVTRKVPKNAKPPIAPNIWIKHEDLARLAKWEDRFHVPIIVVHVFDQEAFCVSLREIHTFERNFTNSTDTVKLQLESGIFRFNQSYDRVDAQGARESKLVFVVSPDAATRVGQVNDVIVGAQHGLSASKKYVAHVLFDGGVIQLDDIFLEKLCPDS